MPDCRGAGESRIYSKRAKKSPFAGFVPESGITGGDLGLASCTFFFLKKNNIQNN